MEFAKRLSELAHLTRRLSSVRSHEARARHHFDSTRPAPILAKDEDEVGPRISAGRRRGRSSASAHPSTLSYCAAAQTQLLFRRIPLSVSLVERSWWKLEYRQKQRVAQRNAAHASADPTDSTSANGVSSLPHSDVTVSSPSSAPTMQPDEGKTLSVKQPSPTTSRQQLDAVVLLLRLLHTVEEARRVFLRGKEETAQRRCVAADAKWRKFQQDFAGQLNRCTRKNGEKSDKHNEDELALLRETANTLQEQCRSAKNDFSMLRTSLVARSFVSARLWQLLLRKSLWAAAVMEHKRAAAGGESSTAAPPAQQLLFMCLAFSRISMGVLRDYVEGRSFSRHAPRFVVSMPSRSWHVRKRKADTSSLNEPAAPSAPAAASVKALGEAPDTKDFGSSEKALGDSEDALFLMLQESVTSPHCTATDPPLAMSTLRACGPDSTRAKRKQRSGSVMPMRWVPPHTAHVIPLASETLTLHSLVLPEMDVPALLRLGCAAELLDLCVTLQRLASGVLALTPQQMSSPVSSEEASTSQQRTLHRLEDAIITVGQEVKRHLIAKQYIHCPREEGTATMPGRLEPVEAARLAAQLHALRLVPPGDAGSAILLSQLLRDMFPELRTKTSRVLQEKARQSSLLAFATRPHRMKLYAQHGRRNAEGYVLGTIVQQARLQQRQLVAALRERHLTEVHVQKLGEMAGSLPLSELVRLIQLCASHASCSDSAQLLKQALPAEALDTLVTGCLFLAEALLISGTLQTNSGQPSAFSLQDLAILWDATTLLFPLIRAQRVHQRGGSAGRLLTSHTVRPQSIIWATFGEHVLVTVNGALAQRLQNLEKQRQHESTAMRRARSTREGKAAVDVAVKESETVMTDSQVTVDAIVRLATGVLEYAAHDEGVAAHSGTASTPISVLAVRKSVRVLARLLHELVLHDRQLWHSLRILPATQRNIVGHQLVKCFQAMDMMDDTTTRALDMLDRCSQVEL
ncbi:hypothetical protein JKF63_00825 [Porcisia hertigi]|uniref:Uncharacterized protein n=1 Tax=Porcisia hertigi TaxID=2761500 RepID=A0A836L7B5_9TRYP|nr:hypothetical protein JKF63_00825 [Porcisia hertigi]